MKTLLRFLARGFGVGLACVLVYVVFQVPARTPLRIVYAPALPGPREGMTDATTRPHHGLGIVPRGNALELRWQNVIADGTARVAPAAVFDDGAAYALDDPWLSRGAQRIAELHVPLRLGATATSQTFAVYLRDRGESPACWQSPKAGRSLFVVRPRRRTCKTATGGTFLRPLEICRGDDTVVTIDTAPLPFLVAGGATLPVLDANEFCYSGEDGIVDRVAGGQLPPAGIDVPYTLEDELTGQPWPRAQTSSAVSVTARVVSEDALQSFDAGPCFTWKTKMSRVCWRALTARPADACVEAWPIVVDETRHALHLDPPRARGLRCLLLIGVEASSSDAVHAIKLELDAP
jgi:hypothetical protein